MLTKNEIEISKTTSKVVVNYHKHPEVGGTGHVSIEATHEGKTRLISVYPNDKLSPLTPLSISSMYVFPTKAVNHSSQSSSDSPIHATYDITDKIENMDAAMEEMDNLHELMNSGRASFSLTPCSMTQTTTAILNSNTSTSNMLLGLKVFDRALIDSEISTVVVINCAEAVSRILEAGGMKRPDGILSFPTPSSINSHFASLCENIAKTDSTKEQSLECIETVPEQTQAISTEENPGLFTRMFNSLIGFFTPQEAQSSTDPTTKCFSNYNHDWPSHHSEFTDEPEKVEVQIEISSTEQELVSGFECRNEDRASPKASECSDSFFSNEPVTAQREEESDLDYCSRYDSIVN
ncbi:hypothetical protein OQJ05_06550 [Fluoribacter gormanii]|uniref:hypothetical protein n=1 Tax=Fluoribacter gormanii TaxID=464 RepID=UPI0022446D5B|nr:hypothetical protein [Fluoribacter gormanii]MCW8443706.1 hypothetical protein [Fluoribacter gormanii]